ncbi:hypothetical protein [Chryseolinea sp. H1M3-3]|uniref:hypothetical protein n=1 Tax=Chryseolinea sp. H1M3-3 TaxID=3034144 RepID=UPI0023ED4851|nr:hypothetical protein [Chryseolinea sp. H1M3-3]
MKAIPVAILILLFGNVSYSQAIHAVTDNGEEVILNDNGTWKYLNDSTLLGSKEIPTNDTKFDKAKNSTFLVKSTKLKIGVWLNTKKWKFGKAVNNDAAEYEFSNLNEDMYGMIITEKLEIPVETLKLAAIQNARTVAPDIQIAKEEYRNVNGTKVLMMEMRGTFQGIKVVYFGYYLTNSSGSTQFLTYTAANLFNEYSTEMEELLNGLVILN